MQTQHYGFKLFEASEKPTWLTDWNTTMNKIDSTIARISGGGGDLPDIAELAQRVQALEGRVDSDELRLNVVEGDIVDMLQTLSDVQTALSQAQSDIVANKTYSDAQISTLTEDVTSIRTSLGSMSTSITSLSDRVTALENAPAYSLPTASASTLGGVKVGSGLSIDDNGVLSTSGGSGLSFTYQGKITDHSINSINNLLLNAPNGVIICHGSCYYQSNHYIEMPSKILIKFSNYGLVGDEVTLCNVSLPASSSIMGYYRANRTSTPNFTFSQLGGMNSYYVPDVFTF